MEPPCPISHSYPPYIAYIPPWNEGKLFGKSFVVLSLPLDAMRIELNDLRNRYPPKRQRLNEIVFYLVVFHTLEDRGSVTLLSLNQNNFKSNDERWHHDSRNDTFGKNDGFIIYLSIGNLWKTALPIHIFSRFYFSWANASLRLIWTMAGTRRARHSIIIVLYVVMIATQSCGFQGPPCVVPKDCKAWRCCYLALGQPRLRSAMKIRQRPVFRDEFGRGFRTGRGYLLASPGDGVGGGKHIAEVNVIHFRCFCP